MTDKHLTLAGSSALVLVGSAATFLGIITTLGNWQLFKQFRDGNYCHPADNDSGESCNFYTAWPFLISNTLISLALAFGGAAAFTVGGVNVAKKCGASMSNLFGNSTSASFIPLYSVQDAPSSKNVFFRCFG